MVYKVVIVVVSYNHEKYIGQAIQSILNQKVDFSFNIIVADDGSQDKTVDIVRTLKDKYPDKITLLEHTNNQGVLKNILRIIPTVNSQYFAILDGDDYWINDFKLQKQVDFLDNHTDFAGCFHDVEIINTVTSGNQYFDTAHYYSQRYPYNITIDFEDIVTRKMIVPSSALMLRADFLTHFDVSYLFDNYSTLWKLSLFALQGRKIKYFNECWSIYRNHNQGISKGDPLKFHFAHIHFLKQLLKLNELNYYRYDIYQAIVNEYKIILESKTASFNNSRNKLFRQYIWNEFQKVRHYRIKLNEIRKGNC